MKELAEQHVDLFDAIESKEKAGVFRRQTEVLKSMTSRLVENGFQWVLPVMLAKSTDPLWPDPGASIEKRIEIEIYGETVKTMQSMIIHKRVLASLGPEKFFTVSPNIRIEKRERAETGRHLYEFTQLDLEMADASMTDVFKVFEDIIRISIVAVRDKLGKEALDKSARVPDVPRIPFAVHKRKDLESKYGKEWADGVSKQITEPIWVTDIPREFYDFEDEESGEWRNFDLILPNGYGEVISGAEREYEFQKIVRKLDRDSVEKENFALLLRLAKDKRLRPSAGAGLGLERFVSYVCGVKRVADIQPFPRVPGTVSEL